MNDKETPMAKDNYRKLTIACSPEVVEDLERMASEMGIEGEGNRQLTQVVKRAIALHRYVWDNRDGELLVRNHGDVAHLMLATPVPEPYHRLVAACRSLRDDLMDRRDPAETTMRIFDALAAIDATKDPA